MLQDYISNPMKRNEQLFQHGLPLQDEAHVAFWNEIIENTEGTPLQKLQACLPQICIPIQEGVSQSKSYKDAVLRGVPFVDAGFDEIAEYEDPDAITLHMYTHDAGSLPVVETSNYNDFEHLNRALASKCEPVHIADGIHAAFIAGLPNPGRMLQLQVEASQRGEPWGSAMQRLLNEDKTNFYDKIVLMHTSPYGNVPARNVGLSELDWIEKSSLLRIEHEMTHYATNRMLGSFRLNIHDELLADFMGFTSSLGFFSTDLFFLAMGIDGDCIPGNCRFRNYCQALDEDEIQEILLISRGSAFNLEKISNALPDRFPRSEVMLALGMYGIKEMGEDSFFEHFFDAFE
jgi:hypothetical protein